MAAPTLRVHQLQLMAFKIEMSNSRSKRCAHCKTTITGPCLTALDASWHPDCFTCTGCRTPLSTGRFIERNGKPLCINCAAPTCAACSSKIANETVLTALGSTYHAGCFVCVKCSKTLGDGGFVIKDGAPHCSTCAAAKCAGCRAPIISGTNIGALNKRWHAACFRCVDCPPSAAALDSFHAGKDGQPYCRVHYDRKYCERCAGCDEPMSSCGTVSVSGRTFHSTVRMCVTPLVLRLGEHTARSFSCSPSSPCSLYFFCLYSFHWASA